jgi:hypothetical protein
MAPWPSIERVALEVLHAEWRQEIRAPHSLMVGYGEPYRQALPGDHQW